MTPTLQHTAPSTAQRVIGSYPSYADAERAVDHLSDQHFPVEHIAIVGRGLRLHEQVTGRLTLAKAAGYNAGGGAILGAMFGWIFGLFDLINPLVSGAVLAGYGLIFGAVLGALLGLVAHALTRGRRDFTSISALSADSYDLLVDDAHAEHATRLLAATDTDRN